MTTAIDRAPSRPRSDTRSREKINAGCEWDWPPERRHLRAGPIIDADRPRGSGSRYTAEHRIADIVFRCVVLALKIAIAIPVTMMVIFSVWLICTILTH
jgi:hypothetical protein